MKWNKPYQLMRVIKKASHETSYETIVDHDDLFFLMKLAGELLIASAWVLTVDDQKEEDQLEIWYQGDTSIKVIGKYFIHKI